MTSPLLARRGYGKKLASLCLAQSSTTLSLSQLGVATGVSHSQLSFLSPSMGQLSQSSSCFGDEDDCGSTCGRASFEAQGYRVRELLGSGTLAAVYRVKRENAEDAAVKRVQSVDEEYSNFTRMEYEIMRDLNHPSIVRVMELVELPQEIWIVQELCGDGNVSQYVQKHGPIAGSGGTSLAFQLVEGVAYLHGKRVLHRDLKPANLFLLEAKTRLKIGDFNSATRIGQKEQPLFMLSTRGTPNFLAPEMRFGGLANERSDVWSMGLSIFYMGKASLPFDPMGRESTMCLKRGELPEINWNNVADATKSLVLKCLAVRMQDRPAALEISNHAVFQHLQAARRQQHGGGEGVASSGRSRSAPPASAAMRDHPEALTREERMALAPRRRGSK